MVISGMIKYRIYLLSKYLIKYFNIIGAGQSSNLTINISVGKTAMFYFNSHPFSVLKIRFSCNNRKVCVFSSEQPEKIKCMVLSKCM